MKLIDKLELIGKLSEEKAELDHKIIRIGRAIESPVSDISQKQVYLMMAQEKHMKEYSDALLDRIDDLKNHVQD